MKDLRPLKVEDRPATVTYTVDNCPLGVFMRQLSADTGASVVWIEALDKSVVSLNVSGCTVESLLGVLARRYNTELIRDGSVWYLGKLSKNDRLVYVTRVLRVKKDRLKEMLEKQVSEIGVIDIADDGVIVVADKYENINSIQKVVTSLQSVTVSVWAVQFYLVQESQTNTIKRGLDFDHDIQIAALLSDVDFVLEYGADISAALRYEIERESVRVLMHPFMLLLDGGKAAVSRVESIPIPQYTTSNEGTVTVSGYENIDVGFTLSAGLRDCGGGMALLDYSLELGEVSGYVNNAVPIEQKDTFEGETIVGCGVPVLLGSFQKDKVSSSQSGTLGFLRGDDSRCGNVRLWAKIERIAVR